MSLDAQIEILDGGLLSSVQDLGRFGYGAFGVSPSGATDWLSARSANRLLGNPPNAALIETTMTGLRLRARSATAIAVCGASAPLTVAGNKRPLWQSLRVHAGAEVVLAPAERGVRSYVAFFGGIDVQEVLGSASTDVAAGFGGIGHALGRGDELALLATDALLPEEERAIPAAARPFWRQPATLRTLPGPHTARFTEDDVDQLCGRPYRVSARSNRQGLRLEGAPLRTERGFDVISAGVCAGCVQISSDGMPIVLLAEHQTTGGYAVPLVVIAADLPDAAQLRPGDELRFSRVTRAEADQALVEKMCSLREGFDEPRRSG